MRDRELVLTLVAERDDEIAGYVAFSRLTVVDKGGEVTPAIRLAPLAVAADVRRCGIGGALVRTGLALLRERCETLVFVLGDPVYYGRFGFEGAGPMYQSPYNGPHFMLTRLGGGAPASGTVRYPAAFAALG